MQSLTTYPRYVRFIQVDRAAMKKPRCICLYGHVDDKPVKVQKGAVVIHQSRRDGSLSNSLTFDVRSFFPPPPLSKSRWERRHHGSLRIVSSINHTAWRSVGPFAVDFPPRISNEAK